MSKVLTWPEHTPSSSKPSPLNRTVYKSRCWNFWSAYLTTHLIIIGSVIRPIHLIPKRFLQPSSQSHAWETINIILRCLVLHVVDEISGTSICVFLWTGLVGFLSSLHCTFVIILSKKENRLLVPHSPAGMWFDRREMFVGPVSADWTVYTGSILLAPSRKELLVVTAHEKWLLLPRNYWCKVILQCDLKVDSCSCLSVILHKKEWQN